LPPSERATVNPSSDVYSLGVLLFEMIAGQPPFRLENIGPQGPESAPLDFAECCPDVTVPPSLRELVRQMLHRDAAQHGISADHVQHALNALLGRPSVAPPSAPPDPITSTLQSIAPEMIPDEVLARTPPAAPPNVWATEAQPVRSPLPPALPPHSQPPPSPQRRSQPWAGSEQSAATGPVWPSLPQGLSPSTFPPPARDVPSRPPGQPSQNDGGSGYPPPTLQANPSSHPRHASQPPGHASQPPPGAPFPFGNQPLPPAPHVPSFAPSFPPPRPSPTDSDPDADFRPSFIGRLKRLFGKKPPPDF
jgi:hypothetical protein